MSDENNGDHGHKAREIKVSNLRVEIPQDIIVRLEDQNGQPIEARLNLQQIKALKQGLEKALKK